MIQDGEACRTLIVLCQVERLKLLGPNQGIRISSLLWGSTEVAHLFSIAPSHRARSKGVREDLDRHKLVWPAGLSPVLCLVLFGRHL